MKVTLINPSEKSILKNAGDRPPLGLLYIAAYLIQEGHEIKVLDMNHKGIDEVVSSLNKFKPEYIGITFTTPMLNKALELATYLKRNFPEIKLVAGGHHVSADVEGVPHVFDYYVVGEGEQGFSSLLKSDLTNIQLVIDAGEIENIDDIPMPARELLDMRRYNLQQDGKRTATLISSRGCTGACVYCSRKALGQKFRAHSPERVRNEIVHLKQKYGYESFYFCDDMFTYDRDRVMKICNLLEPLNISYRITTRADCVDKEMLKKLYTSGCNIISIGIEHADNGVLIKAGKGMTIEQNEQVIKWCHEIGIKVKGFFIINLPGATKKTAIKTIEWAKKMNLYSADFYPLTAYPGSALWDRPESFGMRILDNEHKYIQAGNGLKINIDSKEFPRKEVAEVMELCQNS